MILTEPKILGPLSQPSDITAISYANSSSSWQARQTSSCPLCFPASPTCSSLSQQIPEWGRRPRWHAPFIFEDHVADVCSVATFPTGTGAARIAARQTQPMRFPVLSCLQMTVDRKVETDSTNQLWRSNHLLVGPSISGKNNSNSAGSDFKPKHLIDFAPGAPQPVHTMPRLSGDLPDQICQDNYTTPTGKISA